MSVSYQHPKYKEQCYFWKTITNVLSDDERKLWQYLRVINPTDNSEENKLVNMAYRKAAAWYGMTSQTLNSNVGSIYRKWPSVSVPETMDYLKTNADGSGISIYQLSQGSVHNVLSKGRGGLFVTYPQTEGQTSQEDITSGRYVATIHAIAPENIINWRTERVGSIDRLTLVVIAETTTIADGYEIAEIPNYRELALENGVYVERLWEEIGGELTLVGDERIPTDATGKPWEFIPFTFIGSETNDAECDSIPLWPLAVMNLKHYQNSADNEESTFLGVQNQPYLNTTDLTADQFEQLTAAGTYFGNRKLIPYPVGIAATPDNLQVAKEMDRKIEAMQALGARLSSSNQAAKTAAQVHGEREGQTSILAMVASNVSEAYTEAIRWACIYMGANPEGTIFTLNQDFVNMGMDSQLLQVIINAWQMGSILTPDYVRIMKRMEIFDDDRETDDYVELLTPLGREE